MRRFLTDVIIFLGLLLVIACLGDCIVSRGLRKTTIRPFAVWNDIHNRSNLDNDLVLIGASSCWAHYNPRVMDSILNISTYNLGIDGHPWYPCQPLRYDTYSRYTLTPKYVVINIDMGTFGILDEPYEREQFFPYLWQDRTLIDGVKDEKKMTWMDRYCPMWRYIGYRKWIEAGVASFFGKKRFEDDGVYKGHRGNNYPWSRASLDILDSITLDHHQAVVDSLLSFIGKRKSDNQEVILVKTPVYHELQDRFTNGKEMGQLYDSIARVANVKLLDYWDHPVVYDSSYFCNPSHLNERGADIISAQLAHDLQGLGIGSDASSHR